jgi:Tfp pilus assembly protein PilN
MKLDWGWKMNLRGNLSQWWDTLAASLLTGKTGLGAYLGPERLTVVQVHRSLSGIQVRRCAAYPFESGNISGLAPVLHEDLVAWSAESSPVSLAVSPHLGFFRLASLPRAAAENLAKVVAYELDRFLPLPADRLLYAFQVLAETETQIHLMLMAVPRDRVEVCLSMLKEASLRPVAVELAPISAGKVFAQSSRPMPNSWLLLHLEEGSFDLTHFQGGKVMACARGRNLPEQALSRAILARVDDITAANPELQVLGLYGHKGSDFKAGMLKQHELEVIYPGHLPISGLQADMSLSEVLPAVGASLTRVGKLPLEVNLLPPEERSAIRFSRYSSTSMLLLILLGLGFFWGISALIHPRVELFRVNRQIAQLSLEAQEVESLLRKSRGLATQMQSLGKIGQSPDKLKVLKDLTELIPDNTWLTNLQLSQQYVNLSGMSSSASDLIPLLDKSGMLKKTEFASPIVTDANKLEHFKIKAEFRGLEPHH